MYNKLLILFFPGIQQEPGSHTMDMETKFLTVAFHRLPLTILLASMAVAIFGPVFYFNFFPNEWMLLWVALVVSHYITSTVAYYFFSREPVETLPVQKWSRRLLVLTIYNGLAWSFGPVVFIGMQYDPGQAAILVVSMICIGSVTVSLMLGLGVAKLLFLVCISLPTCVVLVLQGGAVPNTLAALLLCCMFSFAAVGFDFHLALKGFLETQNKLILTAQDATQARELAERSNAIKSQFVASVSHEIRTPMHAILGMLKLLLSANLNPRQTDYATKVETAAKSLLGLLNDILDFSKIEAERMDLTWHPFRLDLMLHDLSVVLSANSQNKPVEVLYDFDPDIPKVLLGDAMRLRQVLLNIAGNAVKFTLQGEVILRIKKQAQTAHDCTLYFSVEDTGIGIAPENLGQIFAEFGPVKGGEQNFGGAGLGLSISRRLVSMMGGELRVTSTLGRGSNFFFELTLPALENMAANYALPDTADDSFHVLVVDSGTTARELTCAMCHTFGWTVESAASGEDAVVRASLRRDRGERDYDTVIVNWALAGMNGWQTIEALQAQQRSLGSTRFVMVSAYGRDRLIERTGEELDRLSHYLTKPFTAAMLHDAIVPKPTTDSQSTAMPLVVTPAKRVPRLSGVKVLVVEDNLMNQQVVQELLQLEGAAVQVVGNGQQAVDLLAKKENRFDAVLMDLQMPNMDGYAATRIIRKELGLHNLPVIAITANMMSDDKEASFSAGMNAHIGKPFNIDLLVRVIQKERAVTKS